MNRRDATLALIALGTPPITSVAQQSGKKVWRIGLLSQAHAPSGNSENLEAFRRGLKDSGYVEGNNIRIEYRSAEGVEERSAGLAQELVKVGSDVLVVDGGAVLRAAMNATKTVPIVMMHSIDPVAAGLVKSLARPGGNLTGIVTLSPELIGKRLELLKEGFPAISRVAVLTGRADSTTKAWLKGLDGIARRLAMHLQALEVKGPGDFDAAFDAATKGETQGLIEFPAHVFHEGAKRIMDFAAKRRIPAIFHTDEFAEHGGLMSYGANYADLYRRMGLYVDRLLKGAKASDLPIEQPTKLDLVINLKTAKTLGFMIPSTLLLRADRVIE